MLTMKDVVRDGHPALRKKSTEVTIPLSAEDKELLEEMLTFVKNSQDEELAETYDLRSGVGIAAPQLGVNKRLVAIHFEDDNEKLYSYKLVNPKIISHSVEKAYLPSGEGCLSVDEDIDGYVPRYARITVKAFTPDGEDIKLRLRGLPSVVFQHEIDHLNGVIFYDHINKENPFAIPDVASPIE